MDVTEPTADAGRITADPEILGGKPVVRGTRLSVELVLDRLAADPDVGVLLRNYPRLTLDDVRACLAYARDVLAQVPPATGADGLGDAPGRSAPAGTAIAR